MDARDRSLAQLHASVLLRAALFSVSVSAVPHCASTPESCVPAPAHVSFPCIHSDCANRTDVAGTECSACLFHTDGAGRVRAVCAVFGCLRPLRTSAETEAGVCDSCRTGPHKCEQFGCLKRALAGERWCTEHQNSSGTASYGTSMF